MLALIRNADRAFVAEQREGGAVQLGLRRLTSPAAAGWSDGNYALLALVERPLTAGKVRTGEAVYDVRRDDVEKVWPEGDPPPPPTTQQRFDDLFMSSDARGVIEGLLFEIVNRVLALEGSNPITLAQFRAHAKTYLPAS